MCAADEQSVSATAASVPPASAHHHHHHTINDTENSYEGYVVS